MSETNKLIVIDITEYESTQLDDFQNIKSIKSAGELKIKNPSRQSRLWNLTCDLKETLNTNLEKKMDIGTINPGEQFSKDYSIQEVKKPSLKVIEVVDTARDLPNTVNNTFLANTENKCKIKLSLTNSQSVPILNINLSRELPPIFQNVEIQSPNLGEAKLETVDEKKILMWEVRSLEAEQTVNLVVLCRVNTSELDKQNLGSLEVNYLVNNHQLSLLKPEVVGLTDSLSGVSRDESTTPGSWDCEVEFINESEFQVLLEKAKVTHNIPTGEETVVSETPNKKIDPNGDWFFDFTVESQNVPELSSKIDFTPLFVVIKRVKGEISKEPTYYPVLSAEIEKSIQPPQVNAYANTDMQIVNTVTNNGSASIDNLQMYDKIPKDFILPEMKDIIIEAKANTEEVVELQERLEFIDKIEILPEDQDPDNDHEIKIKMKDLSGKLLPDTKLRVRYPLLAKNPKPEESYKTPVKIKINSKVAGNFFENQPSEEPEIKIKYVKRKLKTLKSIRPGLNEGEFDISIRVRNKGKVELENILVKDKIPSGFSLSEYNPPEGISYEVTQEEDKSVLNVRIPELAGKDSLNIKYTCGGEGDYPRYEPQVVVKGRSEATSEKPTPTNKPTESSLEETSVSRLEATKEAKVNDWFNRASNKLNSALSAQQLAEFIEKGRDILPPGPVLHKLMAFARELREKGDKMVVGSFLDEVSKRLQDFKNKYL
ncbi:MAG: hypothetical protein ACOC35_04315 [Promethearchaeia archaeon]